MYKAGNLQKNPPYLKTLGDYIYDPNSRLGSGGFATVFKAFKKNDETIPYAIKRIELKGNTYEKEEHEKRIERSMALCKDIDHENITKLYDHFTPVENGEIVYYLIYEYCEGGTLEDKMRRSKKITHYKDSTGQLNQVPYLPEEEIKGDIIQIANGFKVFNERKLLHRDLKPQNIVYKNSVPKIIDLDFVKSDNYANTQSIGTRCYQSPESVKNEKSQSKCDIWSFGIMIYELLYGRKPWCEYQGNEYQFYQAAEKTPLIFPNTPLVSEKMKTLLKGMIVFDQNQRFTWDQVFQNLEEKPLQEEHPLEPLEKLPSEKEMVRQVGNYRYYNKRILGKGSYSAVYVGYHVDHPETLLAIKQIQLFGRTSENELQAYLKEANILNNKNIVKYIDVVKTSNIYIIFEYCQQGDLEKFRQSKECGYLSEAETLVFMTHICNGYKDLIAKNIIHRDLKPANILLHAGEAKIGDFGKARYCDPKTAMKMTQGAGTPYYSSPENLQGDPYDNKCDLWSFGVMVYELLYGRVPWAGNSGFELVQNIRNKGLDIPEMPRRSKLIKELLGRMLVVDANERFGWEDLFTFMKKFEKEIDYEDDPDAPTIQIKKRKLKPVIGYLYEESEMQEEPLPSSKAKPKFDISKFFNYKEEEESKNYDYGKFNSTKKINEVEEKNNYKKNSSISPKKSESEELTKKKGMNENNDVFNQKMGQTALTESPISKARMDDAIRQIEDKGKRAKELKDTIFLNRNMSEFFENFARLIKYNFRNNFILTDKNGSQIKDKILEHLDSVSSFFIFKSKESFKELENLNIVSDKELIKLEREIMSDNKKITKGLNFDDLKNLIRTHILMEKKCYFFESVDVLDSNEYNNNKKFFKLFCFAHRIVKAKEPLKIFSDKKIEDMTQIFYNFYDKYNPMEKKNFIEEIINEYMNESLI